MTKSLKVLVVDDVASSRMMIEAFVTQLGHSADTVKNGFEAVLYCEEHLPDMILMDVVMPMMDGFEATRRIRQLSSLRWLPIIFLTALDEHESVIVGLEAGGDDYLIKPVDFQVLAAKLKVIARVTSLQEQREEYANSLQSYYVKNEEEQSLARHVMTRLATLSSHGLRNVATMIKPAEKFSGDVVLALRSPSGVDHLLLADCTGHGLTAAITSLPVVDAFIAMTERGFGVSAIVRTINRKMRHSLPVGYFVAAAIVAIDHAEKIISVWNGGIPNVFFLDEDGRIVHRFRSEHPALGIMNEDDFDSAPALYRANSPGTLLMCSDGVTEATSPAGVMFDLEAALLQGVVGSPVAMLDELATALTHHVGQGEFQDDTSFVLAACHPEYAEEEKRQAEGHDLSPAGMEEWQVTLRFSALQLRSLDCLTLLTGWVNQLGLSRRQLADVLLVVTELFNNALDHGVLGMDSSLKNGENGFYSFLQLRLERLASVQDGHIVVELRRHVVDTKPTITIAMHDSGKGFDPSSLSVPISTDAHVHGRGIALVRERCSAVRFLDEGRRVEADYLL
ncbi:fused response regulator/phosphatase [Chitinimonas prasina]|uniref:Fused response regulator/phosphatase n=1 Tax=Chitinimonas prasina TaxID=1434937 RepID=A0ABQ5YM04_9NEIS|nr:fused response regulator/phosphatase [Chitinimonas prasina]GLR14974.1 fused response regulator/phosphatase [Chitinimonas prasina]